MLEFLFYYGLFLAKGLTVLTFLMIIIGFITFSIGKSRTINEGVLTVKSLNLHYEELGHIVENASLDKPAKKKKLKEAKKKKKKPVTKEKVFLIDFDGDIKASETEGLSEKISAAIKAYQVGDEVLIRLTSPGGLVPNYGLAAQQLIRFRSSEIPLTICVDKVAASGGYLMACVANKLVSAPLSVIGSIGVVAQVPNFHRLLKENKVDIETHTAGQHKRTLTMFGRNTDEGREKFKQDIQQTHRLFQEAIQEYRPNLDLEKVSTGEFWYGKDALSLGLVDELGNSDDILMKLCESKEVLLLKYEKKQSLKDKVTMGIRAVISEFYEMKQY